MAIVLQLCVLRALLLSVLTIHDRNLKEKKNCTVGKSCHTAVSLLLECELVTFCLSLSICRVGLLSYRVHVWQRGI